MKRLPLLGLILALASCGTSIGNDDQGVACFDTGSGVKCVPLGEMPSNTTAICSDNDGEVDTSQSSASGPSLSDNDTSESSDAPTGAVVAMTGGDDDDDDGGGEDSSSTEDPSGNSVSSEPDCGGGAIAKTDGGEDSNSGEDGDGDGHSDSSSDGDGDGVSDSKDCDCIDPDSPTTPPPGDGPIIN